MGVQGFWSLGAHASLDTTHTHTHTHTHMLITVLEMCIRDSYNVNNKSGGVQMEDKIIFVFPYNNERYIRKVVYNCSGNSINLFTQSHRLH